MTNMSFADVWNLFLEKKQYDYLLNAFEIYSASLEESTRLQLIEVNTYIQLGEDEKAQTRLLALSKKLEDKNELASIYENLGHIQLNPFKQTRSNHLL